MSSDLRDDDKQRVRDASNIVDIVGQHVALRPRGREFVGLCPFHDDHTPSMAVIPHKDIFYCHACGTGGDVFSFVQKFHRMEFRQALEYLAQRAGIDLKPATAKQAATERDGFDSNNIAEANGIAHSFFRAILAHAEHGERARTLIDRRGISAQMVQEFELGAAPQRFDGFLLKVQSLSRPEDLFIAANLLKRRDAGGLYDTFRDRLMFPIHDQMGRVIAFGARRIDDNDQPKYLNSAESPLFHKSDTLYGLRQAARSIQRERRAVIVEGYTDVIACHQAGFTNVVGTLGTALTVGHARTLRRLCDEIVLLFDGDEAGTKAADRAIDVFFNEDIDVRIATLSSHTDAKDPDELLARTDGPATLKSALELGTPLLEYRFDRIRVAWAGKGPSALNKALTEEIRHLADLGLTNLEPRKRALIMRRLHEITGLDHKTLTDTLPSARARKPRQTPEESATNWSQPGRALPAPHALLGCLLIEPKLWRAHAQDLALLPTGERFDIPTIGMLADCIMGLMRSGQDPSLEAVLDAEHRPEVQAAAIGLATATETQTERNMDRVRTLFEHCLSTLWADHHSSPTDRPPTGDLTDALQLRLDRLRQSRERLPTSARANPWRMKRPN